MENGGIFAAATFFHECRERKVAKKPLTNHFIFNA